MVESGDGRSKWPMWMGGGREDVVREYQAKLQLVLQQATLVANDSTIRFSYSMKHPNLNGLITRDCELHRAVGKAGEKNES